MPTIETTLPMLPSRRQVIREIGDSIRNGRSHIILGKPGVGKSHLANEICEALALDESRYYHRLYFSYIPAPLTSERAEKIKSNGKYVIVDDHDEEIIENVLPRLVERGVPFLSFHPPAREMDYRRKFGESIGISIFPPAESEEFLQCGFLSEFSMEGRQQLFQLSGGNYRVTEYMLAPDFRPFEMTKIVMRACAGESLDEQSLRTLVSWRMISSIFINLFERNIKEDIQQIDPYPLVWDEFIQIGEQKRSAYLRLLRYGVLAADPETRTIGFRGRLLKSFASTYLMGGTVG
ncbi:MAG: hypothetical protein WCV91_07430 [Candidatus Margulisiibacteriota bacterium]